MYQSVEDEITLETIEKEYGEAVATKIKEEFDFRMERDDKFSLSVIRQSQYFIEIALACPHNINIWNINKSLKNISNQYHMSYVNAVEAIKLMDNLEEV
jgi:hypothetical protein